VKNFQLGIADQLTQPRHIRFLLDRNNFGLKCFDLSGEESEILPSDHPVDAKTVGKLTNKPQGADSDRTRRTEQGNRSHE
jgi:hypothetical protein